MDQRNFRDGPLLRSHPNHRPYLPNSELCPLGVKNNEGLGGYVSLQADHFLVHESPLYFPAGEGEHQFALILKYNLSTDEALAVIARSSGLVAKDITFSGRKDKYALSTQWISATHVDCFYSDDENVKILYQARHKNKLKLGHLKGNVFQIYISEIENPDQLPRLLKTLSKGVPNYFGRQRFGKTWYQQKLSSDDLIKVDSQGHALQDPDNWASDNVDRAIFILTHSRYRKLKRNEKLALSALQSSLFNLWLGARIRDGLLDQVILGDVCRKKEGGTFYSTDPEIDTQRLQAGEIEVLGPLFGPKIFASREEALEREQSLYATWGIEESMMEKMAKSWRGDRRSAVLQAQGLQIDQEGDGAWLRFMLSKGAYATTLCTELIQPSSSFERLNNKESNTKVID